MSTLEAAKAPAAARKSAAASQVDTRIFLFRRMYSDKGMLPLGAYSPLMEINVAKFQR